MKGKVLFHFPVFETLEVLYVSGKTVNNLKQTVFPACGLTMALQKSGLQQNELKAMKHACKMVKTFSFSGSVKR